MNSKINEEVHQPQASPEGWYGEGGGRGLQDGEHMYTRGGFMSNFFLIKKIKSQSLPISFLNCSEKYNGKTHVNFKESQYRK